MRYGTEQTQMAQSPFEGRGTGIRHSGGGSMAGKKGDLPMGGYTQGDTGGLSIMGFNPTPGSLYRDAGPTQGLLGGGMPPPTGILGFPSQTTMGGSTWGGLL